LTEQDTKEKTETVIVEIVVNGLPEHVPAGMTVAGLMALRQEEGGDLIVERNHRFVFPQEYEMTLLETGDRIELIHADFGG
jgi:thiamine biosynthesis protein ThiS